MHYFGLLQRPVDPRLAGTALYGELEVQSSGEDDTLFFRSGSVLMHLRLAGSLRFLRGAAVSAAVRQGRTAEIVADEPDEGGETGESALPGDLPDRQIGPHQQNLRFGQAAAPDVLPWRHPDLLVKKPGERAFPDAEGIAEQRQIQRRIRQMALNPLHALLDQQ